MECTACGATDELVYVCQRCGDAFCATHHARQYHDCQPEPTDGPETPRSTFRSRTVPEEPSEVRPRAQLYPQEVDTPGSVEPSPPPDVDRPGYGPERFTADPVEPASTVPEWFRRQTYLSLTVKIGLLAAFCNLLAFSLIGAALVLPLR